MNSSSDVLMDLCYRKNSAIVPYLLHSAISKVFREVMTFLGIVILATAKTENDKVVVEDLVDNTLQICDLLQCEFIFCKASSLSF